MSVGSRGGPRNLYFQPPAAIVNRLTKKPPLLHRLSLDHFPPKLQSHFFGTQIGVVDTLRYHQPHSKDRLQYTNTRRVAFTSKHTNSKGRQEDATVKLSRTIPFEDAWLRQLTARPHSWEIGHGKRPAYGWARTATMVEQGNR